ncbi:MAG: lipoate protein ligase C-terminal domain-containing protein [Anaerolineae bacterium]
MKLYDLGHVPWIQSQLIYHAMPRLGMEGILYIAPVTPYVCIGCHQDVEQDIDLDFCRSQGIPVFRREIGGGGVYLDGDQIFYQIILHRGNPLAAGGKTEFYRRLLEPVADTYTALGIPAQYRPVNDVITADGCKISGNGVAQIGDYVVLAGNLIVDFDYATMVKVLRVPDEKFRDKVFKSMQENLTTIRREIGETPSWQVLTATLMQHFEPVMGPLEPGQMPAEVYAEAERLKPYLTSDEWLYKRGKLVSGRDVKIAEGVNVVHKVHKAPGGLIRGISEIKDGHIVSTSISGDFFFYPAEKLAALEEALAGVKLDEVESAIVGFYQAEGIESPGVTPADFARVIAESL